MEASNETASGGFEHNEDKGIFEYFGWVYHLGMHSIGHEYCHLRFLFIRGKCVAMYKRDPHENPGIVCLSNCLSFLSAPIVVSDLSAFIYYFSIKKSH